MCARLHAELDMVLLSYSDLGTGLGVRREKMLSCRNAQWRSLCRADLCHVRGPSTRAALRGASRFITYYYSHHHCRLRGQLAC
jgi:hypothetical protein